MSGAITKTTQNTKYDTGYLQENMARVLEIANEGVLEIFELENADEDCQKQFEALLLEQLESEFGDENAAYLLARYKSDKISPGKRTKVERIIDYATGIFRKERLLSQKELLDRLGDLLRAAFNKGGLDEIDYAIEILNDELRALGSSFGLGPGSACMDDEHGRPAWLAIVFSPLDKDEILAVQWCSVGSSVGSSVANSNYAALPV